MDHSCLFEQGRIVASKDQTLVYDQWGRLVLISIPSTVYIEEKTPRKKLLMPLGCFLTLPP